MKVTLRCAKRKDGENYECAMVLNGSTRWFSAMGQVQSSTASKFDLFVETMKSFDRSVSRREIEQALPGMTKSMITRYLKDALNEGIIVRTGHGLYRAVENVH